MTTPLPIDNQTNTHQTHLTLTKRDMNSRYQIGEYMKLFNKSVKISAVVGLSAIALACSDNSTDPTNPPEPGDKVATLSGTITADRTLSRDTVYTLKGYVKVAAGASLIVQDGTTVVGDTLVSGSSLWILPGAKIIANGTAERPIVFTSGYREGTRSPGDWGGIVIIGKAKINRTANPIYTEGPSTTAVNYAGGNDDNDNSGILRYVRIEFAGYDVSDGQGQELNSLSMYAVGRGTTIEYVQTVAGLDDSFEWFGGTVDGRYLISYESGDDHFDWTEGYRGRNQFLIAYQSAVFSIRPGAGGYSTDPRGFEGDGCENNKAGCTFTNAPFSNPVFANFTLIGPGTGVYSSQDGNGVMIRRGSGGTLVNGVIARWPGTAVAIRDQASDNLRAVDSLVFRNVTLVQNGKTFDDLAGQFGGNVNIPANNFVVEGPTVTAASLFASLSPVALDFTPSATSSLRTGGLSTFPAIIANRGTNFFGSTVQATTYRGAADPSATTKWWAGWTKYLAN